MGSVIGLLVGLLIAVAGAAAKWFFDRKIALQRNAFDLHRELHAKDMVDARTGAWKFLQEHPELPFKDIESSRLHPGEARYIWHIMQFFHRLATAWKRGFVAQNLMLELFGELFVWWDIILFRKIDKRAEWVAIAVIDELYARLHSEVQNDPNINDLWESWHRAAERDASEAGISLLSRAGRDTSETISRRSKEGAQMS